MHEPHTVASRQSVWSVDTGQQRLRDAHAKITTPAQNLKHVFTQIFNQSKPEHAHATSSPLAGALVSIKDLFDVAGYTTRAGTRFLQNDPPALTDAMVVAQLRIAGALLVGHTNMTELAYSGLGLNPHYGTPANALLPDCIPGGSTSGGAVSVATGVCDIAIGTDTGGSLRIPAAFNGIVGFKPTQSAVSRDGCKVLSHTLDSVGPMANSVRHCQLAFQVMRQPGKGAQAVHKPVFVIPSNYVMEDLDSAVAQGFDHAVQKLSRAGFNIETRPVPLLDSLATLAIWQFAAVEARAVYDDAYAHSKHLIDPRIASRLARAEDVDAVTYRKTLNERQALCRRFQSEMADTVLLMPTVPISAPRFTEFTDDETYNRLNLLVLRNPSIANVLNGCSVSLPYHHNNTPTGIMLSAPANHDDGLLSVAQDCETALLA